MGKRKKKDKEVFPYNIFDIHSLDLSKVDDIRGLPKDLLIDPKRLEIEVLPQLGLNNEVVNEFPESLSGFFGSGLQYWQYPNQFSKYLVHLSKYKIESYLEIGVRHGGTFIITLEYLNRFNKVKRALGIDIADSSGSLNEYKEKYNPNIEFMRVESQNRLFKRSLEEKHKGFDLALIDGDHSYWGCRNDFEALKELAHIIVFHDICNYAVPEVNDLWIELKDELSSEFNFYEFTDQYKSIQDKGEYYLGIGVMVDKGFDFIYGD